MFFLQNFGMFAINVKRFWYDKNGQMIKLNIGCKKISSVPLNYI